MVDLDYMKYLRITMPDNSKWDVPADRIAHSWAMHYAKPGSGDWDKEYNYCLANNSELEDWAENNMNWEDVAEHAQKVESGEEVDYQEGWVNGEKQVIEV